MAMLNPPHLGHGDSPNRVGGAEGLLLLDTEIV